MCEGGRKWGRAEYASQPQSDFHLSRAQRRRQRFIFRANPYIIISAVSMLHGNSNPSLGNYIVYNTVGRWAFGGAPNQYDRNILPCRVVCILFPPESTCGRLPRALSFLIKIHTAPAFALMTRADLCRLCSAFLLLPLHREKRTISRKYKEY